MSTEVEPTITLIENEDGWWTARRPALGVPTQDDPREATLENLAGAVQAARKAFREKDSEAPRLDASWDET